MVDVAALLTDARRVSVDVHLIFGWALKVAILSVLLLTPYGVGIGDAIRASDVLVSALAMTCFAAWAASSRELCRFRPNWPVAALSLFVALEMLFPLLGVVAWADAAAGTSTFRAVLYWIPLLFIAFGAPGFVADPDRFLGPLLNAVLVLSAAIAVTELLNFYGALSDGLSPRKWLERFALDDPFSYHRAWIAGVFINSTMLAAFCMMVICHHLAIAASSGRILVPMFWSLTALILILLSTSRVGLVSAVVVLGLFLASSKGFGTQNWKKWLLIVLVIVVAGSAAMVAAAHMERYLRVFDAGLDADYSWLTRVTVFWPAALAAYAELGRPFFTNPVTHIGVIDSGYITYYIQGGPVFLASAVALPVSLMGYGWYLVFLRRSASYSAYMAFFSPVYVLLGMITANPLRNPVVILVLSLVVVMLSCGGRYVLLVPDSSASSRA